MSDVVSSPLMEESGPPASGRGASPSLGGISGPAQKLGGTADDALLAKAKGGDVSAGEELVRRFHVPLRRYLLRLTGSDAVTEELHQQTWLSVLEHADRFNPRVIGGGFKAWLFRIATNKANDFWRSAGRERSAKDGLRLITDEQSPAADQRMESAEQERKLQAAIAQLPEAQRQVLLLRYYSGLKFIEIAEVLGCPLNTALGRMHKAMLKLKELMSA